MTSRGRRHAWAALAVASGVALAVGVYLTGTRAEAPEAAPPPAVSLAPPEPPPEPLALFDPEPEERGREDLEDAFARMPRPASLASVAAQDYRERARYPKWSHAITNGVDPLRRDRQVTPGHSFPRDAQPVLWVEPEKSSFEAPAPVVILARMLDDGLPVAARDVRGEVRTPDGERIARLDFRDDGREGDPTAGDLEYTAQLDSEALEGLAGTYLVLVEASTPAAGERKASTGFLYSVPQSQLTGRYRDSVVGGNLVVEAEMLVFEQRRFHLEATLGSLDGEPLAWAQFALSAEPGLHWVPLTFYGLALSEREAGGPFQLLSVALSTTGEMPNHKNALVRNAHVTAAYEPQQFTAEPFGDPDLLNAARRLEADGGIARGGLDAGGS